MDNSQILITKDETLNYYVPTEITIPEEDGTYNLSVVVKDGEISYTLDSSSSGLPEVTNDDNGKVLAVVDGQWDKTELNGGVLLVHGTGSFANGWTMDKTPAEIQSANNAGAFISFVLDGIENHVIPTSIMFDSGTSDIANGYVITCYGFTNINVSDKEMFVSKEVYTVTNNGKMTSTSTIYDITVTNITTT